tara:strand:+ start:360 stop:722 length:363 start_codon:yes stop_codon:yes gene_type:complete
VFRPPLLSIGATSTTAGVESNIVGVKLFRGTEAGGVVPIGATVTSGLIILMIVPGVEAGIVPLLAGIVTTGILRPPGRSAGSVTLPAPVTVSVMLTALAEGVFVPVLITFTGPKQISPVS